MKSFEHLNYCFKTPKVDNFLVELEKPEFDEKSKNGRNKRILILIMSKTNLISYSEAINQATKQAMELSQDVMVMGQLIDYKSEYWDYNRFS